MKEGEGHLEVTFTTPKDMGVGGMECSECCEVLHVHSFRCVSGASPVLHAAHPFHTGKGTPPVGSRLRYKTNFPREINSKCSMCEMFTECFYPDGPGSSRLLGLRFFSRVVLSVMDRKKSGR
ncbi:hypothetical protein CEXT_261131 [Caerostris extrusa]|uniref:Uncharacterized protein n=1 Tax=Caerostris extrusa TaxID=172846 RepID=A0AAV4U0E7_CAEEX|nr:hypothetical protein CEXT_261131 [Caerostris extrusa]